MTLKVTLLGTGSPIPDPHRAGPSTLVQTDDATILVDAGRGCVMRLAAAGIVPPMLSAVLLTHLHSDHLSDLNDVVTSHWVMPPVPLTLHVYGPPGTREAIDSIRAMLRFDERYRMDHHDDLEAGPDIAVTELRPGQTFELNSTVVSVFETDHRPVDPTIGFRIE